jgi:hypothetical protein
LNGRENEALFPRFGTIDPTTVGNLESEGIFRPDTERHRTHQNRRVSEFVCFNNVLCETDLREKLNVLAGLVSEPETEIICTEWRAGAQRMFVDGHLVSFRGTEFSDLDKLTCRYVDFSNTIIDREIAGPLTKQQAFEARCKADSCDMFISHASEDKVDLVRPLAQKLRAMGFVPWFDESQVETGDELKNSLDKGILCSRCGLVVVSRAFMSKKWTQYEVETLMKASREGRIKLLFVWHGVKEDDVKAWSAELAGRVALDTSRCSIDELALKLARGIH